MTTIEDVLTAITEWYGTTGWRPHGANARAEKFIAIRAAIEQYAAERVEQLIAERDALRALATCGCGDEFTNEHPGICCACAMPPVGA
jgi:hypothetical protein